MLAVRRVLPAVVGTIVLLAACSRPDIAGFPPTENSSGSGFAVGDNSGQQASAYATITAAVKAGLAVTRVPTSLHPTISGAPTDNSLPAGLDDCRLGVTDVSSPPCEAPSKPGASGIALFGDSHAAMWADALETIAQQAGDNLLVQSKSSCPPPLATFWLDPIGGPDTSCNEWRQQAIARIKAFKPKLIIVTGEDFEPLNADQSEMSQSTYSAALVATLKELSSPGTKIVVLGDIPYLEQAAPLCLAAHESDVQACSTPTSVAVNKDNVLAQFDAATQAHASYINVAPWMCTSSACPPIIDNIQVYENRYHITDTFAQYLEPVLAAALGFSSSVQI